MNIVFGTDGWRARIADEYTFDAVRVCAQSVAEWVVKNGGADRGIVIGFDRRFASEHFAAAAAEALARELGARHGAPVVILRPANQNGPRQHPGLAASAFASRSRRPRPA